MSGLYRIDWLLLTAYAALILALGLRGYRRGDTLRGYLLAHFNAGWFTVGLSLMVSLASSLGFVAVPSAANQSGALMLWSLLALPLVYPVVTRVFIPMYRRMNYITAYEYLEHRFDYRVRLFASGLFIAWRTAWMAAVVFVPAMALQVATDGAVPLPFTVIGVGLLATAYTLLGGMRGILLADIAQAAVMFGGVFIALASVVAAVPGGMAGLWHAAAEAGRLDLTATIPGWEQAGVLGKIRFYLYTDFTALAIIVSFTLGKLGNYGVDQLMIQRYLSARDEQTARRGFLFNCVAFTAFFTLMTATGIALAVFSTTAEFPAGIRPDGVFPYYVAHYAPPGLAGLMIAALLAAAVSSFDSGINSCAAAFTNDFLPRLKGLGSAPATLRDARTVALLLGCVAVGAGCVVGSMGDLFQIALRLLNSFLGPLLAVFLLGIFTRRTNAPGAFWGMILGTCGTAVLVAARPLARSFGENHALGSFFSWLDIGFLWVAPAGLLLTLSACALCTLVAGEQPVTCRASAPATPCKVERGTT